MLAAIGKCPNWASAGPLRGPASVPFCLKKARVWNGSTRRKIVHSEQDGVVNPTLRNYRIPTHGHLFRRHDDAIAPMPPALGSA
jgi:hypothetical protein